jgi:hypothetical protein
VDYQSHPGIKKGLIMQHSSQRLLNTIHNKEMQGLVRWFAMIQKRIDAAFSENPSTPVPYTGRRHGNGLVGFKKPRTIQERRCHEALMTDTDSLLPDGCRLVVRAKRINLPNGYEDRNKVTQRSWKAHRLTQYK